MINSCIGLNDDSSSKELYLKVLEISLFINFFVHFLNKKAKQVLEELMKRNPQYHINGTKNIWILKPSSF